MRIGDAGIIVHKDVSYDLVGAAFRVFNQLGYGLPEKAYQQALAKELKKIRLKFRREVYFPVMYEGERIARYFVDFLIEDKIILELKVVTKLQYSHAKQLLPYLRSSGKKLGILLYFTREGVKYRRVLNSVVNS